MPRKTRQEMEEAAPPAEQPRMSALLLSQEEIEQAEGFHPVPSGSYSVTVRKISLTFSKKGFPMLVIEARPIVEDDPLAGHFRDFIVLPTEGLDTEQRELGNFALKNFTRSLNVNLAEFLETIQLAYDTLRENDAPKEVELVDYQDLDGQAIILFQDESVYTTEDGIERESPAQNRVKRWI